MIGKEIGHRAVKRVKHHGDAFATGKHSSVDALLIQFPQVYTREVNDTTNVNAYSTSFDFLLGEPELYIVSDLRKLSSITK